MWCKLLATTGQATGGSWSRPRMGGITCGDRGGARGAAGGRPRRRRLRHAGGRHLLPLRPPRRHRPLLGRRPASAPASQMCTFIFDTEHFTGDTMQKVGSHK